MGKCPHIDWSWLLNFPLCSASKSRVCYGEFTLLISFSDCIPLLCLHQLFLRASISFKFYFVSSILHSALPIFATQVTAASDITGITRTTLKNCYHVPSHTTKMRAPRTCPQRALENRATDFLLKTGDACWKLRLRCGVQFPRCTLALRLQTHTQNV
jgi:hypothetical protein